MNNLIYAYKKRSTDKVVYVGQTNNLENRNKQHLDYDPFNQNSKEYEYPLSRGIRKYGKEEYQLIILEQNLDKKELDEREIFWIAYYNTYFNGYNQTPGGSNLTFPKYQDADIKEVIEMLKDESFSFKDIKQKTGLSLAHISNINQGKRRPQKDIKYPIRSNTNKGCKGLKFSPEECLNIHLEILKNEKSISEIAKLFNCSTSTIGDISNGKIKAYKLEDFSYPLRNNHSVGAKSMWKNR